MTSRTDKVQLHSSGRVTLKEIVERIGQNPRFGEVTGILTFTGIVKGVARDGRELSAVEVEPAESTLRSLQALGEEYEKKPGVLEVRIHRNIGKLEVSDTISHIVVATTADDKDLGSMFQILFEILEKGKRVSGMRLKECSKEGWYYTRPVDKTKSYD